MKKTTKTAFRVMLFFGLIICGTSIANASASAEQVNRIDKQLSILDGSNISIEDMSVTNVYVGVSPDNAVHITYHNTEHFEYEVEQNDDELILKRIELSLGISNYSDEVMTVRMLIPTQFSGALAIDATTGDMSVSDVTASSIDLNTTTGSIDAERLSSEEDITIRSTTGDIDMLDINSDSGILTVKTSTGNKILNTVSATSIYLIASTGWSNLAKVVCTDINIEGSAGHAEFSELDAQNITIDLSTGDVRGSLVGSESDFSVVSSTNTGKNNLPSDWGSGSKMLDVSTNTGDIDVSFTK